MQPALDRIFIAREASLLWAIAGAVLVLAVVKGFATYLQSVLMTVVGQRVIADVQMSLFARLMRADLAFFHANSTGSLISRFTNDANLLRNAAANILAAPLRSGTSSETDLAAVQRRREFPTRATQRMQILLQNRVIGRVLRSTGRISPPRLLRLVGVIPTLRRIFARLVGLGARPEHVSPAILA